MRTDISSIRYNQDGTIIQIDVFSGVDILYPEKEAVVMQCTGLKDKNGVEIYEGDIVKCRDANYLVSWNDGASNIGEHDDKWGDHLGWYLYRENKIEGCYDEWLEICSDTIYEVVGNIYENKELLNV